MPQSCTVRSVREKAVSDPYPLAPHYAMRRVAPRTTPVRLDQLGVLVLVTAPSLHRRTEPRLVLLTPLPGPACCRI